MTHKKPKECHERKAAQHEDLRSVTVQAEGLKDEWLLPPQREEKQSAKGNSICKGPEEHTESKEKRRTERIMCLDLGDGGVAGDVAGTGVWGDPCQLVSKPALSPFLTFPST